MSESIQLLFLEDSSGTGAPLAEVSAELNSRPDNNTHRGFVEQKKATATTQGTGWRGNS